MIIKILGLQRKTERKEGRKKKGRKEGRKKRKFGRLYLNLTLPTIALITLP